MDQQGLISFVHERGLGVIATRGPDGSPQAALVGLAATDRAELIFDTSISSRKYANIEQDPHVAVVIGWDNEVTVQLEGTADILSGDDLVRGVAAYFEQYPDGRQRAESPEISHVRITPRWLRYSDYRPGTFGTVETTFSG
jgi:PPOX class probable F420-dependent enzyme